MYDSHFHTLTKNIFFFALNFEDLLISVRVGSESQSGVPRHGHLQVPSAAFGIAPNTPIKQNIHWSDLSNIPANYNDTEINMAAPFYVNDITVCGKVSIK